MTTPLAHGADGGSGIAVLAWLAALGVLAAAATYATGIVVLRRRGVGWPASRTAAVVGGLACFLVALSPPITDHDGGFSVHVWQHVLLAMLGPLLLAMSAPVTLALRAAPPPTRRFLLSVLHHPLVRVISQPVVVLLLDVGGLYALYLTPLYEATADHPWVHLLVHTHMVVAGCLLAWTLVGRDPVPSRPGTVGRLVVLGIAATAHDVLTKLMYARTLPQGPTVDEIRTGAQTLYYAGTAVELVMAVAIMTDWYARTGRELRRARRRTPVG